MTDAQLATMAEMVLIQSEMLHRHMAEHRKLWLEVRPLLPANENLYELIRRFDALDGIAEQALAARAEYRTFFGLPPAPEDKDSEL